MGFEWIQHDWLAQLHTALQVLIAAVLGGVVGLERETVNRPAGLRTHALLAAAASLLTLLVRGLVVDVWQGTGDMVVRADPVRVVEAIVVGVSFLGAGTIVRSGADVTGLTTAASLLFVAGIGIAVALGQLYLAFAATVLALVILRLLRQVEPRHDDPGH